MTEPGEPSDDPVEKMMATIDLMYSLSGIVHDQFMELAASDPEAAAKQMSEFLGRARNISSGGINQHYLEAIAGGPNQDYLLPIINSMGNYYAQLPKEVREVILEGFFDTYDSVNFQYIRWFHTPKVTSPELLRDICLNRGLYFPDLSIVPKLMEDSASISELVA